MKLRLPRKNGGFTLTELLVSIGIISLLTTLLVPGLGAARLQAQRTSCLSQMRQLGEAFLLYTAENNQVGPYDAREIGNDSISLWKYQNTKVIFGPLMSYIENLDVSTTPALFICPGASRAFRSSLAASGDNTSYWMNPDVTSNPESMKSLLGLPGSSVVIMDSCTWWQPGLFGPNYDNHSAKGVNVFRMDGSASWIPITKTLGLNAWDWNQLASQ